jgi:hypothetical protein
LVGVPIIRDAIDTFEKELEIVIKDEASLEFTVPDDVS